MAYTPVKDRAAERYTAAEVRAQYHGTADETVRFLLDAQLLDSALWRRFVDQFRDGIDGENQGWRGEYWGKSMRGGALVYAYSHNEALYEVLTETVRDMLTVMEEDGRVSSYSRETEFDSWDIWCRKYVMLGLEYYLPHCRDAALRDEIVTFLCRLADYLLAHIGEGEGKTSITAASRSWRGINSSSVLEPMVRLYRLTGESRYLDFCTYIVKHGGAEGLDIFRLAYLNRIPPYRYGVSKAYEMTSCFEGLLEYYLVTGEEWCRTAVLNYGRALLDTEMSIIGSSGCTHELFDHTVTRQTAKTEDVVQETCVTVTLMKLFTRLYRLTGERAFAEAVERSYFNAYLGALNTERRTCPYIVEKYVKKLGYSHVVDTLLPFDSYSPLTPGVRGRKVGGNQLLADGSYYGCCACIGAAGVGVYLENTLLQNGRELLLSFYESGESRLTVDGKTVRLSVKTDYPYGESLAITVEGAPQGLAIKLRDPETAPLSFAALPLGITAEKQNGYWLLQGDFVEKTCINATFGLQFKVHRPITWETDEVCTDMSGGRPGFHEAAFTTVRHAPEDDEYVAFTLGPITLAADSRLGRTDAAHFSDESAYTVRVEGGCEQSPIGPCRLRVTLQGADGETLPLVDYASAGLDWQSPIAAWLSTAPTREK